MAGIYLFPKNHELKFIEIITNNISSSSFDYGVKKYDDYFFYVVDADNYESSTGIYEIVSYGKRCPYISEPL